MILPLNCFCLIYLCGEFVFNPKLASGTACVNQTNKIAINNNFFYLNRKYFSFKLLSGAQDGELNRYKLKRDVNQYHYIRQGKSSKVNTISDKSDYKVVHSAFKILGFSSENIEAIWKIVAAILHLVSLF